MEELTSSVPISTSDSNNDENAKAKRSVPTKVILFVGFLAIAFLGAVVGLNVLNNDRGETELSGNNSAEEEGVKLVYLVHWTWDEQLNGLKKYLDEYTSLHPSVTFEVKVVSYADYPEKLELFHDTDTVPDIYQVYSSWGVGLVENGVLAVPPDEVIADVEENYLSTSGVTIDGKIWGIPSEVNDYCLVIDKNLFDRAGLVDANGQTQYPQTWNQLIETAKVLTKKDQNGVITQYGIAFGQGEDWGVVDPFLSLLWSNEGTFLTDDYSQTLVNSDAAIEALEALDQLYNEKITDVNGNIFDFGKGNIAMVIAPPWLEATFRENFGERFNTDIEVVPLPPLKKQTSLQYSWFVGVMEKSSHKKEAWEFLKWFTSDMQPETGTTRYGDLLADIIGAIPARKVDAENHEDSLGNVFKKMYVDELIHSTPEPNVLESARIKKILMDEISAVWVDEKTPKEALDEAKIQIDNILKAHYTAT